MTKGRENLFLVLMLSLPLFAVLPGLTSVYGNTAYNLRFESWIISGDDVLRDFYIQVDGAVVAHGFLSGSGALSASVVLSDSAGHIFEAWPIINRDRSVYGGRLYSNGQICAQGSDVHQDNHLICTTVGVTQMITESRATGSAPLVVNITIELFGVSLLGISILAVVSIAIWKKVGSHSR